MGWNRPGYIRKKKMKRAKKEWVRLIIKMQAEAAACGDGSCGTEECQKEGCGSEAAKK